MIGRVEEAMLARLRAASRANVLGYAYREVESLPVDVDELLAQRIQQYPSAWTVFGGWKVVSAFGDGSAKVEAKYHVIVAAQNVRNERSTRLGGSASEVGSYQMALDVAGLLAGQTLDLPIAALELGACTSLYTGKRQDGNKLSLFAVEFATRFLLEPGAPEEEPGDFRVFHVDWDTPPHGGVDLDPDQPGVQLPADQAADLSQIITLPTEES